MGGWPAPAWAGARCRRKVKPALGPILTLAGRWRVRQWGSSVSETGVEMGSNSLPWGEREDMGFSLVRPLSSLDLGFLHP